MGESRREVKVCIDEKEMKEKEYNKLMVVVMWCYQLYKHHEMMRERL